MAAQMYLIKMYLIKPDVSINLVTSYTNNTGCLAGNSYLTIHQSTSITRL